MNEKPMKKRQRSDCTRNDDSLLHIFTNNPVVYNKGRECIADYINRNVTLETKKAIAIHVMTSAMSNLECGIVEAAKFASHVSGYSTECVRRWAFSFFTITVHSCLDGIDDEFVQTELSSDRGKASVNDSIIHDEGFQLSAHTYIR